MVQVNACNVCSPLEELFGVHIEIWTALSLHPKYLNINRIKYYYVYQMIFLSSEK